MRQLGNYLEVNKIDLCNLLKSEVYNETQINEQNTMNIIKSEGFFAVLRKIGVLPYPENTKKFDIYTNLESYLSLDKQNYPFTVFIEELNRAIRLVLDDPNFGCEEVKNKIAEPNTIETKGTTEKNPKSILKNKVSPKVVEREEVKTFNIRKSNGPLDYLPPLGNTQAPSVVMPWNDLKNNSLRYVQGTLKSNNSKRI